MRRFDATSGDRAATADSESVPSDPHECLRADPDLGPLVETHGPIDLEPAADPFRRLCVSVLRQQVSMDAAAAIRKRLFETIEVTPEGVLAAEETTLREAGCSAAKAEYLQEIAETWIEQGYSREQFAEMDDSTVLDELTAIRGVGDWTGKMFLMFCLGRPDVFPVEDLGIRKGMWKLYDGELTRGEMRDVAERWHPCRSYASLYLWRAVD